MLQIIPQVKHYSSSENTFSFTPHTTSWQIDSFFEVDTNNDFIHTLQEKMGHVQKKDSTQILRITYQPNLANEAYHLELKAQIITLHASSYQGVVWALQSLLQLLPPLLNTPCTLNEVKIEDEPQYIYRGLHLDVCRHFFTVNEVKDFIEQLAFHKLNRLHWHLTDDQGWRIEIKKYPKLTEIGSIRKASPIMWDRLTLDDTPYGPFYFTQEQVKEIVRFAKARGVMVIPEIELPGHAQAAISAYPEIGCTGGPYEPWCHWGVSDHVFCAGNDQTIAFLKNVFDEITECFEAPYIHIGGDECPKIQWKLCPKCQKRMLENHLKTEEELQSWLVTQIGQYLKSKGKTIIGWDEILEGGIPKDAVIMSWQGTKGGITAANAKHNVIMTPNTHLYLDYAQSLNKDEPESIFGFVPLETVYDFFVDCQLPPDKANFILGAQGNCWSEYFFDYKRLQYSVYPRAAALAEVTWRAPIDRDFPLFKSRLVALTKHYDARKINYRQLD